VEDTVIGNIKFTNIIARKGSIKRRITLAAHYDSKMFTEIDFIGAIDSAVPVGIILDIARVLDKYISEDSKIGLELIFFLMEKKHLNHGQIQTQFMELDI